MADKKLSEELTDAYDAKGPLSMLIVHAVSLAREAEYEAHKAANTAQVPVTPAYPPWVLLLVDTVRRMESVPHGQR